MVWNLFLAAIPAALALVLFRRGAVRSPAWWCLLVGWLLFLPNAPYVLTDVMHMVDDLHRAPTRFAAYETLMIFGAFFALGLSAYVVSLQMFRRYLHAHVAAAIVAPILLAVHGLCVIAMYLGRVLRMNSWDALLAPREVMLAVMRVPRPHTVALLAVTFVATGVAAYMTKAVGDHVLVQLRRWR